MQELAAKAIAGNHTISESELHIIEDLYSRMSSKYPSGAELASTPQQE